MGKSPSLGQIAPDLPEDVSNDPKCHTGTPVGIYANNDSCGDRKSADFDYFKYED